jgi:hypothetical protein
MSSSMSLSKTKFDSNQKAFNQLRISCKSLHKSQQKENILNTNNVRDFINDMKAPIGGGLTRHSSRDLKYRGHSKLKVTADEVEMGKQ